VSSNLQFTLSYANVNGVVNVGSAGSTPTAISPTQGLPTSGSARNTAAALGKYDFKAGQLKGLTLGSGISYHDKFRDKAVSEGAATYAVDHSPAAAVIEAFAGYHFRAFKRQMNFTLRGQNLANRKYEDIETSSPTIAAPFTLSGTLEVKF